MPADGGAALASKLERLSFRPTSRRSRAEGESGADAAEKNGREGVAVRVAVRCRPLSDAAARGDTAFSLTSDSIGADKVALRLSQVDGDRPALSEEGRPRRKTLDPRAFKCNAYFPPESTQEELFSEASSIVENVMEGYNGTIFAYGVTGSGKTYTMSGPPEEIGKQREADTVGIAQRVSTKIFEYIRDRSSRGEMFAVEASFLEIYSSDGSRETLIDLLAEDDKKLEVKQDPLNNQAFVCEGLCRVPIRTPDELCSVLNKGQQRCTFMETSRNCHSSRSHCLFMLTVESLSDGGAGNEPSCNRGKLMLVDLAGSESLKKVQAASDTDEELRRKQAIGINRVLTSLGTVVNNMNIGLAHGHRDSVLTMLLRDCLGGNARALLIANIGPELDSADESVKTLVFAQQMMAVKNVASVNRVGQDQSSLLQMRQRHSECIRILQEKVSDSREEEQEVRDKLHQEMDELNKRLITKESAEKTLEEMRDEQFKKIDQMRDEMTQAMSKELEKMRMQSMQDLNSLRQSVEQQVSTLDSSHQQRQNEEHQARVGKIQGDLQEALKTQRVAEEEVADVRVKLASAEERAKMLQSRQEELRRERADFDEERKSLRTQSEHQWAKLTSVEGELQRFKAEAEVQRQELARLSTTRTEEAEGLRKEREAWRTREAELQKELSSLRALVDEARREAEMQALRLEGEQREDVAQLRQKVEKLEGEAAMRTEQLSAAQHAQEKLEVERMAAQQREAALRHKSAMDLRHAQEELEQAQERERELMTMLNEVQDSIITASSAPAGTGAASGSARSP